MIGSAPSPAPPVGTEDAAGMAGASSRRTSSSMPNSPAGALRVNSPGWLGQATTWRAVIAPLSIRP
ncbi:hypothetical protein QP832_08815 [Actinomycetaceae bacterium UMB8041A]|nr:hypothetical protein [Actinomycetaceae bacterium UMB8041A]